MFWNHRIVRTVNNGDPWLQMAEVFYDDTTRRPFSYAEPFTGGSSYTEIQTMVARFREALGSSVLDYPQDFDLERGQPTGCTADGQLVFDGVLK